jgi:alpha-ketoglutarate-dependent taurine dioxygenase
MKDSRDVAIGPLDDLQPYPVVVSPVRNGLNLVEWAREHQTLLARLVDQAGAVLFRGFSIQGVEMFEQVADAAVPDDWVEYREPSTPRSHVSGHVSTSTEYPAALRIYVHNENSHVLSWPLYLFFYCRSAAEIGGCTPLADCRSVRQRLPRSVVEAFEEKGWLYRRNFLSTSATPWMKVFATSRREDVQAYCRDNHMVADWHDRGLTVRYRRWATLQHPRTGDSIWFNHGTFFNRHMLEPSIRKSMHNLGDEYLATNTYYGDGASVEKTVLDQLDQAYEAETRTFAWKAGDMLMVDNMRLAHGRQPYRGHRELFVTMKRRIHCSLLARLDQYIGG